MPDQIIYKIGSDIDLEEMIDLYLTSTLGERRPVHDRDCMAQMLANADLVITAWDSDMLVGIARTLTDFCYAAYLSDLAVHLPYQRQGIGKELIRHTQNAIGPNATLILLAAPSAAAYYPKVGMQQHPSAWILQPGMQVTD